MSLQDEIRAALREVLLPEFRALHADFQDIRAEIVLLRGATGPLRGVVLAALQRLEARIDAMERGVRRPSPCIRTTPRCRSARRRG